MRASGELQEGSHPVQLSMRHVASPWAWGAGALTAAFIAISLWWLNQDHGVPFGDAASHLYTTAAYHDLLLKGNLDGALTRSGAYPPITFVVGAIAMLLGGFNPDAPVVGENLVYVSMLALGCFQVGRLLAGPQAGFLAVMFALGSPLLIEQFHVSMIDAPQAALVAVSVWLILASDRFKRTDVAALAGLAVGVGLASKEQFAIFVVGLLPVTILREQGWRNWRGILAFAGVAFIVSCPWYLRNLSHLAEYASLGGAANSNLPPRGRPPLVSISNLGWYFWAVMNGLLFAPLSAFAAIGLLKAAWGVVRRRCDAGGGREGPAPELMGGLIASWLGITLTPHHDMRYTMSLIVYLAVFGTAWIVSSNRLVHRLAVPVLVLAVVATTLGSTFGIGGSWRIVLGSKAIPTDRSFGITPPDEIVVYADHDFAVAGPRRGDVLGLFEAFHRDGIRGVGWNVSQSPIGDTAFDYQGVILLAGFAGLAVPEPSTLTPWRTDVPHAELIRATSFRKLTACVTLSDGTGLWATRAGSADIRAGTYCPLHRMSRILSASSDGRASAARRRPERRPGA